MAAATESNPCGCHGVTALQTKMAMTKDKIFNWRFCLCCGLFLWFVINLLQGIFTEIQEDEAYYHLWGEHLDWGYFDHPPMVGLMTFLSSHLFNGILGVRFLTIVFSCLSLWVIWIIATYNSIPSSPIDSNQRTIQHWNDMGEVDSQLYTLHSTLLFFTLACSIVMFNIYGFVTTPDAALILFSALFLLFYQRYLADNSWKNAILMGLMMALMVYSKYHAFLFLGLIVFSNLKLLKNGKFWVACLVALALLTPHIIWQVDNGFPSFRYHLSGRSEPFRWSYFWEYLPNQLLIFNPLMFGAVVYVLIKHKPKDWSVSSYFLAMTHKPKNGVIASEAKQSREKTPNEVFERGLKFILIGFFVFFWLMAFRGHVEPHWTIACMIPAVVLVYREALTNKKIEKFIHWFLLPSVLVIFILRILLMTPWAPHFGYDKKYYKAFEQVAGDRPVVFRGSFQRPALYHYYTGKPSSTLRCYYDRMTQYDLWQFDRDWIGQPALVLGMEGNLFETYAIGDVKFDGHLTEHFQTANRLETHFKLANIGDTEKPVFHRGDTIFIDFSIYNPYDHPIDFHHPEFDMSLKLLFLDTNEVLYGFHGDVGTIAPQSTFEGRFFAIVDEKVSLGRNHIVLGIGDRIATFVTEDEKVEISIN